MRRAAALSVATLLTTVLLAACGGSSTNLIPSNNAVTLGADLSSLTAALDTHSCASTQTALGSLLTDINNLPASVATKLRNNLLLGYEDLDNTARTQCKPPAGSHTHTHTTGPSGTSQSTGVSTSPGGTTTGSGGTTTGSGGTTTGSGGTTTGSSGSVGPGGGTGAPPGSTSDTGTSTGGAVSGQ